LPFDESAASAPCWECEAATDAPRIVVIELGTARVVKLPLCPACYESVYMPLNGDASGALHVDLAERIGRTDR
jgi:hypothetical protein